MLATAEAQTAPVHGAHFATMMQGMIQAEKERCHEHR